MPTPNPPTQSNTRVQIVAALSCLLFTALGFFFLFHAAQAVWSLWHESAQLIQDTRLRDHATQAYDHAVKESQDQLQNARKHLYQLQTDLTIKQTQLVSATQSALSALQERKQFEKEALEKGWVKDASGRWVSPSKWAVKRWLDSFWSDVDQVNKKWATVKHVADTSQSALGQAQALADQLADTLAKQETQVAQLDAALKSLHHAGIDGLEKRFQEEWDRQGLGKQLKEAKLNEKASRAGFRVMAILHFSTGLLALLLALRSLARLLQLRGGCQQPSLLPPSPNQKPWPSEPHHAR